MKFEVLFYSTDSTFILLRPCLCVRYGPRIHVFRNAQFFLQGLWFNKPNTNAICRVMWQVVLPRCTHSSKWAVLLWVLEVFVVVVFCFDFWIFFFFLVRASKMSRSLPDKVWGSILGSWTTEWFTFLIQCIHFLHVLYFYMPFIHLVI